MTEAYADQIRRTCAPQTKGELRCTAPPISWCQRTASATHQKARPNVTNATAGTEGGRYLQNPEIAAELTRARAEAAERTNVTIDKLALGLHAGVRSPSTARVRCHCRRHGGPTRRP